MSPTPRALTQAFEESEPSQGAPDAFRLVPTAAICVLPSARTADALCGEAMGRGSANGQQRVEAAFATAAFQSK
ncbi:hypothetical protein [Streptomyces sp. ME19-01-6]|uniref:hypothetical protein n=1 Tax=Streptomyces sp. ME19-01-6 TaxID=3028686 RepID=UPI0029B3130E|nr:hypothetical protein [Streptomyces sp. ME19-01-6]MDX3231753.1 hypothetical protein [Streptomyces sp. ME19-01-6]